MRLIDADKAIQGLRRTIDAHQNGYGVELLANRIFERFIEWLMRAPTVEAEPIRHGKWVHLGGDEWCCSACGDVIFTEGSWEKPDKKYCNECGAKMDGKENEK